MLEGADGSAAVDRREELKNLLEDGVGHFQSLVLHQDDVVRVQIFVQSVFHLQDETRGREDSFIAIYFHVK